MTAATEIKPAKTRRFRFNWVDSFLWFIRIAAIITILVGLIGSIQLFLAGEGPTLEQWRTLVISSISQGAMYGLIALGYSMVYGVLGFINFAHGEVFMAGRWSASWLPTAWIRQAFGPPTRSSRSS